MLILTIREISWVSQAAQLERAGNYVLMGVVTCSTDLAIKLWDTQNDYKNVRTLHGHDHSISTVRFTPDGERLISASRDKTIRIWQVASG